MAEWLRRGLQILARRFDSGSGLHPRPARFAHLIQIVALLAETSGNPFPFARAGAAVAAEFIASGRPINAVPRPGAIHPFPDQAPRRRDQAADL